MSSASLRLAVIVVSDIAIAYRLEDSARELTLGPDGVLVKQWPVEVRGVAWLRSSLAVIHNFVGGDNGTEEAN